MIIAIAWIIVAAIILAGIAAAAMILAPIVIAIAAAFSGIAQSVRESRESCEDNEDNDGLSREEMHERRVHENADRAAQENVNREIMRDRIARNPHQNAEMERHKAFLLENENAAFWEEWRAARR